MALRFFFGTRLDRPELARHLARVHYPRPLPRVLSPEEVGRLLEAAPGPGLKYKAALSIAYGAGLRVGEVVMLRVSDIDSKRMLIRVEQARVVKTGTRCSLHSCSSYSMVAAMPVEGVAEHAHPCPCCGGRMIIVELFEPGCQPQRQSTNPTIRMDTS
jgi:site-specific recombinase XerD